MNYLFALTPAQDRDEGFDLYLVDEPFYLANGHLDSVHREHEVAAIWPAGIEMDEACESTFFLPVELTREEIISRFTAAGFIHSQSLEDMLCEDCE